MFGLNEELDQGGATVGPLITALVLYLHGSYQNAFAALLISASLCLATLVIARVFYLRPLELEEKPARSLQARKAVHVLDPVHLLFNGLPQPGIVDDLEDKQ